MNEEEFEECSVVAYPHEIRFLHIKGGRISYYVDRHISDYVNKIQQENQKLKEMQCIFLGTGCQNKIKEYKIQQREFIEWLEDKLSVLNNILDAEEDEDNRHYALVRKTVFEEILSKYKSIIGASDE